MDNKFRVIKNILTPSGISTDVMGVSNNILYMSNDQLRNAIIEIIPTGEIKGVVGISTRITSHGFSWLVHGDARERIELKVKIPIK